MLSHRITETVQKDKSALNSGNSKRRKSVSQLLHEHLWYHCSTKKPRGSEW